MNKLQCPRQVGHSPVLRALITACRTVGLPSKSSASSVSPCGIGLSSGPAEDAQSLKPEPPSVLFEKFEPPALVVAVAVDACERVDVLEARPFFMAARRAAICSLSEIEDELENPFSGDGSLAAARDSVVLLGEAGGRGERGEGATRAVIVPGLTLRGAEGDGTGGLTTGEGLKDPLDFCGRKLEDEALDVRTVGRANVVGLLVPVAAFPRAEVDWMGRGGGLGAKDDVVGPGDGISDDAER